MRVQVNLSQEILDDLDVWVKIYGTTRASLLSTWITEKVLDLDIRATESLGNITVEKNSDEKK